MIEKKDAPIRDVKSTRTVTLVAPWYSQKHGGFHDRGETIEVPKGYRSMAFGDKSLRKDDPKKA